jgi:predicted ATPase/class 3 adenylate cyclase
MAGLPTGTLTFLFTDIEGSTKLLAQLGDRFPAVLDIHHRLLRDAISGAGGRVVSTEGDAFFAVFASAPAALGGALQAQRALCAEPWPAGAQVRVRMGLHTGQGVLGGDNYTGLDVHRASRIAGAGHGGQILVSEATRGLAASMVPEGVEFLDLGLHRLKDLPAPERLYQIKHPDLRETFPRLRTLDAAIHLPAPPTKFVGRDREVAQVCALLSATRLLTLTGPGGTGKTRLSLTVAAQSRDAFRDGVHFVDLSPINDSALVATTVAQTLEVQEEKGQAITESLKAHLRDRTLLLVLDNFEQIMPAAPLVGELLAAAPRIKVVVTSREALRLSGEQEYPVPPLTLPDLRALPPPEDLMQCDAVALFVQRAREVRPDFTLTVDNARAVVDICARLDGLPLAIELAAARVKVLAPEAILPRLRNRLALLTTGARDLPARQRTLRGAIEWSYELLQPHEQTLFRRLSVFAGGCSLDAVDAVCNPAEELGIDTLDGVASLVDKSLVRRVDASSADPRVRMLETIREYSSASLEAASETAMLRERHAAYFLTLSEKLEPEFTGADPARSLDVLERDHDNLRAALRWSLDAGRVEVGLRLGGAVWRFWQQRSHLSEGRAWLDELCKHPAAAAPTEARAKGLTAQGGLAYWQSDFISAKRAYDESLTIYRLIGLERGVAEALHNLGYMAMVSGDIAGLRTLQTDSLAGFEALGDRDGMTKAREALVLASLLEGDYERARLLEEENLKVYREVGARYRIADGHTLIAVIMTLAGDSAAARRALRESLAFFQEARIAAGIASNLQIAAMLAMAAGQPERAATLAGAVAALRDAGASGTTPAEVLNLEDPGDAAKKRLNDAAFRSAWAEGYAMAPERAIAYALEGGDAGTV